MIVDIVKSVSDSMTAISGQPWLFSDGELYELDESEGAANLLKPFFMLVHPIIAKENIGSFVDTTSLNFKIFLLQQSNLADKQSSRNVIMGRMYDAKQEMKTKFSQLSTVDEVLGLISEEVFNAFDNNFDGLECDITIKFNPSAFC